MTDMSTPALRRLDLTLLLVFDEAMRRRKLTEVGYAVGMTQSAVSHALNRLRTVFDDELFLRRPYGVEPTARARELEPQVRAILDLTRELVTERRPFALEDAAGMLRIAAQDYHCALIAPQLAAAAASAPKLRLSFLPLTHDAALTALEAGEVDLALGYMPNAGERFVRERLLSQGYAVVARKDHPRARKIGTLAGYLAESHLLVGQAGDLKGVVDAELERIGKKRHVAVGVPHFLAGLATVSETDLIATLPRRVADAFANRFNLVVADPPLQVRRFDISAFRHRREAKNPLSDWACREIAAALAGT